MPDLHILERLGMLIKVRSHVYMLISLGGFTPCPIQSRPLENFCIEPAWITSGDGVAGVICARPLELSNNLIDDFRFDQRTVRRDPNYHIRSELRCGPMVPSQHIGIASPIDSNPQCLTFIDNRLVGCLCRARDSYFAQKLCPLRATHNPAQHRI